MVKIGKELDMSDEPAWLKSPDPDPVHAAPPDPGGVILAPWVKSPVAELAPSAPPGAAVPDDPPPQEPIPGTAEDEMRAGLVAVKRWWFAPPGTQNEIDALDIVISFIKRAGGDGFKSQ